MFMCAYQSKAWYLYKKTVRDIKIIASGSKSETSRREDVTYEKYGTTYLKELKCKPLAKRKHSTRLIYTYYYSRIIRTAGICGLLTCRQSGGNCLD